jgi:hypothetical protein
MPHGTQKIRFRPLSGWDKLVKRNRHPVGNFGQPLLKLHA